MLPFEGLSEESANLQTPLGAEHFPNDIKYFNDGKIENLLYYWRKIKPNEGNKWRRWDDRRASAARGKLGDVARRCSMNNVLWKAWVLADGKMNMNQARAIFLKIRDADIAENHPDEKEREAAFRRLSHGR